MNIQTKYNYEKSWSKTLEKELLEIIKEEVGDADPIGILQYIKETIDNGKIISVGNCKFKLDSTLKVD